MLCWTVRRQAARGGVCCLDAYCLAQSATLCGARHDTFPDSTRCGVLLRNVLPLLIQQSFVLCGAIRSQTAPGVGYCLGTYCPCTFSKASCCVGHNVARQDAGRSVLSRHALSLLIQESFVLRGRTRSQIAHVVGCCLETYCPHTFSKTSCCPVLAIHCFL